MSTTHTNPLALLNSLQAVRKFRRTPITTNLRKEIEALENRVSALEKLLSQIPAKEEPKAPEGFFPIHHYFELKPDVSETQIRKLLDDAVESGEVEVGRWRCAKTKYVCKWYRPKSQSAFLS
jgi:hypothetical protein